MDKVEISGNGEEPTMEDILSSIRKIIAEDKTSEAAALQAEDTAIEIDAASLNVENTLEASDVLELGALDDDISLDDALEIPEIMDAASTEPETSSFAGDFSDTTATTISEEASVLDLDILLNEPESAGQPSRADASEDVLELMEFVEEETESASLDLEPVSEQAEEIIPEIEPTIEFEPIPNDLQDNADVHADLDEAAVAEGLKFDLDELVTEDVVKGTTDFDESLDLVMDSDASDYLAPTLEAEDVTATSWKEKAVPSTAAALFGGGAIAGLTRGRSDEAESDDSFEDEDMVAESEGLIEDSEPNIDFEEYGAELPDADTVDAEPTSEKDEDLNLVKSLLADLMDEDAPEEDEDIEASAAEQDLTEELIEVPAEDEGIAEDNASPEAVLDEILEVNVEDEALLQNDAEDILEDHEPESELAKIARKAKAAAVGDTSQTSVDDLDSSELPEFSAAKEFSLLAGVAATAAGIGLADTLSSEDAPETDAKLEGMSVIGDETDVADFVAEAEVKINETITPEVIIEEMAATEQPNQTQEENPMVRIVKTETLLGDETEKDTTDAFASLSDAVQEKAELAENGPAIGELVQEALKPMLQEWLDKNLKGIVTRAVTKEIKRISSTK